ncbi:hypothetical protein ABW20_dc0102448 [Dactylellina cionopaga]|nr:hypothetical protein ABW20_dc0102448 [Dactylellina cionopaga]
MAVTIERLLDSSHGSQFNKPPAVEAAAVPPQHRHIVLYFFFKRGDDGTQLTKSGLSCLLSQLFHEKYAPTRHDMEKFMDVLNGSSLLKNRDPTDIQLENDPQFSREDNPNTQETERHQSPQESVRSYLEKIENLAEIIGKPVYIILDGLDECTDYERTGLMAGLTRLVRSSRVTIKILISSRENAGLEKAFKIDQGHEPNSRLITKAAEKDGAQHVDCEVYGDTAILTVNKLTNREDMRAYLQDALTELLDYRSTEMITTAENTDKRLLNQRQAKQIESMAATILHKSEGMFTYSTMVIASLRQPSPLSIRRRVMELPDQMDNLYARHLESLTTAQKDLVVLALNRVVWGIGEISTLGIVEQFKKYHMDVAYTGDTSLVTEVDSSGDEDNSRIDKGTKSKSEMNTDKFLQDPADIMMQKPEIIYTVRHLEAAGREFFEFSGEKHVINVIHKSVRDWVEKEAKKAEESFLPPVTNILEWGDFGDIKVTIPSMYRIPIEYTAYNLMANLEGVLFIYFNRN